MSEINICPSCGAKLESNVGSQCPFCGVTLPVATNSSSAATLISRPISKKAEFENSAEAVDEVKRLINEGDTAGATMVAGDVFDLKPEDAQSTVDQMEKDMQHDGSSNKTMMAAPGAFASLVSKSESNSAAPSSVPPSIPSSLPASVPASFNNSSFGAEPPKTDDSRRKWIIGGSIGAAVFLCLCCCLPLLIYGIVMMRKGQ